MHETKPQQITYPKDWITSCVDFSRWIDVEKLLSNEKKTCLSMKFKQINHKIVFMSQQVQNIIAWLGLKQL